METRSVALKVARFRELHAAPEPFVVPNPWDAGSARRLAELGFPALATSSAAVAGVLGHEDYGVTREESLAAAHSIVEAVELPVSADLENGFGDTPEDVAQTVGRASEVGLAGCSIEDAKGGESLYDMGLAVERIVAAVEASQDREVPMVLTARVEHYLQPDGSDGLADTIKRLQAYADAGADVLFAPGLNDLAALRELCAAVGKPVSAIGSMGGGAVSVAELAEVGVKRISTAASLYSVAMAGLRAAAIEVRAHGTFGYAK